MKKIAILTALFCMVVLLAIPPHAEADPCVVVDNGTGTVTLPPDGCPYLSPDEAKMIIDGLPAGTVIELAPIHQEFVCRKGPPELCENPGGTLGGSVEFFDSVLSLRLQGTGDLDFFTRELTIPVFCEVHTGPRNPGDPVQDFDNEMFILQGGIFGDPDFDVLQMVGGSGFGLPSPGHTTLTRLGPPGSEFQVDSFFDISYQIDFQGAPGSALEGMSGSTPGTVKMKAFAGLTSVGQPSEVRATWGTVRTRLAE